MPYQRNEIASWFVNIIRRQSMAILVQLVRTYASHNSIKCFKVGKQWIILNLYRRLLPSDMNYGNAHRHQHHKNQYKHNVCRS